MGHYTEFYCTLKLKSDTPKDVVDLLRRVIKDGDLGLKEGTQIFNHDDVFKPEISHPFFKCERWWAVLIFNDWGTTKGSKFIENDHGVVINIHVNFKNYDDEIDQFLDWIKPYIRGRKKKTYIGWWRPENMREQLHVHLHRIDGTLKIE